MDRARVVGDTIGCCFWSIIFRMFIEWTTEGVFLEKGVDHWVVMW